MNTADRRARLIEKKKENDRKWIDFCNEPDNPFNSPEIQQMAAENERELEELRRMFPNDRPYISIHEYPCDDGGHRADDHFRGICVVGKCKCTATIWELIGMHRAKYDDEHEQ